MRLLKPLIGWLGRLSVGRKLTLIYLLDLTAVIYVSGILIHEKYLAIDFARKEIVGTRYSAVVRDLLLPPFRDAAPGSAGSASVPVEARQARLLAFDAEELRRFLAGSPRLALGLAKTLSHWVNQLEMLYVNAS